MMVNALWSLLSLDSHKMDLAENQPPGAGCLVAEGNQACSHTGVLGPREGSDREGVRPCDLESRH